MRELARESKMALKFMRFSADNGIHELEFDDHKSMSDGTVYRMTQEYIRQPHIRQELEETASMLADIVRSKEDQSETMQSAGGRP